ncbi:MAG: mitochondrial fission ELM1 family protein [Alphaproteobacteria bacterium]|nr:mitochondrial fission ELM1 family protein [Alphaproteobacteria bacterium]
MKKILWALLDDRRGSVGQAKGIIEALGDRIQVEEKQVVYNKLASLPNWIRGRTLIGVDVKKSDDLQSNFPDMILSTSRRTLSVARYIRKLSKNTSKIVQLMYPSEGVGLKDVEFFVVPAHDSDSKQKHKKAFVITGAPTRIFEEKISDIANEWNEVFKDLPKPWISVIVGGAIKGKAWPKEEAENLVYNIRSIYEKVGGSILITTSRRTGENPQKIIMEGLKDIPKYTYIWGEKKDNPIMGFYACADIIIATADSVSMCCEACGSGHPVLLYKGINWLPKKHRRFAQSLINGGYAQDLCSPDALNFRPKKTLNPANEIAQKILETFE